MGNHEFCTYCGASINHKALYECISYLNSRISKLETASSKYTSTKVINLIHKLGRGCSCSYDYRCANCETIVQLKALIA